MLETDSEGHSSEVCRHRHRSLKLEERQSLLEAGRDGAELCSAGWKAESISDKLGSSAEISKQRVGGALCVPWRQSQECGQKVSHVMVEPSCSLEARAQMACLRRM